MFESFVTAFIIYFVVIDPIGNAPVFLAVTSHLDQKRKLRVAVEGAAIATAIMLFFALCGAWVLSYLQISEAAFKIAGGIILFLVALDMLAAKRQQRKREESFRINRHHHQTLKMTIQRSTHLQFLFSHDLLRSCR